METAAAKAGMDAKTARKYRRLGRVPSELTPGPRWRTREDAFQGAWQEVQSLLEVNQGLEAKTIFEYLQRRYPGRFADGQLRTLQRRVKIWRATEGPAKEVFFARIDSPKLLLRGGWLPHSKCYRREPTPKGENEETDQIDHTTRTNSSH